jgi:hypothetical protein
MKQVALGSAAAYIVLQWMETQELGPIPKLPRQRPTTRLIYAIGLANLLIRYYGELPDWLNLRL